MLAAEIVNIVGYLREDYRTIVGAVLSIISGKLLRLPCRAQTLQQHLIQAWQMVHVTLLSWVCLHRLFIIDSIKDGPRVGWGHPLSHCPFTSSSYPFLLFPFFHWLYPFSSFVHPFPFYQNCPTPFPATEPGFSLLCLICVILVKVDYGVLLYLV